MTKRAFLFAGQGAQKLGMASDLYATYPVVKETFDTASRILGYDLRELIDSNEEKLNQTRYTQPAILTTSVAIYRLLAENGITPDIVAGLSLGEYSALVAAGALSFEDAVALVAKESNAHQNFKNKILKAKDIDTVVSASVVGHPVRAIKNKLASAYNQAEKDFLAGKKTQEEIEELGAGALRNAVVDGDVDNGSVMAGQIAGLVSKEETCAEILEDIYYGAAKVIQREAARWADVNV